MRIDGSVSFRASRERVFAAFSDKDALARSTPGLQGLNEVGPDQFEAVLKVGVAGVTGTYKGSLELQDKRAPEHFTLSIQGNGGPGFVRGACSFDFADHDDGTTVSYLWDVQVGGIVASVGQRVLGGVAKQMIGQFMTAMAREVESSTAHPMP